MTQRKSSQPERKRLLPPALALSFMVIGVLFLSPFAVCLSSLRAQTHHTDTYTIVGDPEVVNGALGWNASAAENEMHEAGLMMELTVKDALLYKTGTGCSHSYYFALCMNHDLNTSLPDIMDESTLDRTWGMAIEVATTGVYDIVYSYNPSATTSNKKLTYTLTLRSAVEDLYTITVLADPPTMGTVTGGGRYECGKKVTLKATANNGCRFIGWDDGVTSASRSITVSEDATYTALFAQGGFTLVGDADLTNGNADWDATATINDMTFTSAGEWRIEVTGKPLYITGTNCHPVYRFAVADDHDLTKSKPNLYSGTTFKRTLGRPLNITQSGVYDLVFTYKESQSYPKVVATIVSPLPDPTYHVTVVANPSDGGVVSVGDQPQASTASTDVVCGSSTEITASPASGWRFTGWDDGSTAIVRTVTPTGDVTYVANFTKTSNSFTLGGSLGGGGGGGSGGGGGTFTSDGHGGWTLIVESVTLIKSGTPCSEDYSFYVVRDDDPSDRYPSGTGVSVSVPETGVYTITIVYQEGQTKPTYTLDLIESAPSPQITIGVESDDESMGTVSGGGTGDCGSKIKISATPNPGYIFLYWLDKDGTKNTSATRTITLTADNIYTAYFAPVEFTVIGDIALVGGDVAFDVTNEEHNMQVQADGVTWVYTAENVSLSKTDDNGYCRKPYYCAVAKDHALKPKTWPNVVSGSSYIRTNGKKVQVPQTGIYNVIFTFNYTDGELTVKLVMIEELPNPTFTISAVPNDAALGYVEGAGVYECGTKVKLTASNYPGSRFVKWSDNKKTASRSIYVTEDVDLVAFFEPTNYTLIGDADVITTGSMEWDPTDTRNQMTLSETGAWRIEVKNKTLIKTGTGCHATYRFAVALDHAFTVTWPTGIKSATNRTKGVEIKVAQSGIYDIVYTFIDGQTAPTFELILVTPLDNPTHTITAIPNIAGLGTVTASPEPISGDLATGAEYECGTQVTLTAATTGSSSKWVKWSTGSTTKTITITVTKDADYVAEFNNNVYGVRGDADLVYGNAWDLYEERNDLTYAYRVWLNQRKVYELWVTNRYLTTCDENYSYRFTYNRADKYPTNNNLQLDITQNGLYDLYYYFYSSSEYKCIPYLVEAYDEITIIAKPNIEARGSVTGGGTFTCEDQTTLTATANSGYVFKYWRDESVVPGTTISGEAVEGNTNPSIIIATDHNATIVAVFDCEGGCPEVETLYLGYEATTVPGEYDNTHPTFLAYPEAVIPDLPQMDCEEPVTEEEEGLLPGLFSVSETKKVRFSQGNLQFNATLGSHKRADGTTQQGTWRIAEHQWDYVGNEDVLYGTVFHDDAKSSNTLMAEDYDGWIDLFNWGNSGWEESYPPYNYEKYYPPSGSFLLTGEHENADWGVFNAISNAGDQPGMWRILTQTEWTYLYSKRANFKNLRSLGTVCGVFGYIFLPDDWQIPNGLTFTANATYTKNVYSPNQWKRMEEAGAIFLPAAGMTQSKKCTVSNTGKYGYYWTATCTSGNARHIQFSTADSYVNITGSASRDYGRSVRLVKDATE